MHITIMRPALAPPCAGLYSGNAHSLGHYTTHNRFLLRNWWCGITPLAERSQVTAHIRCVLGRPDGRRRVMVTVTTAFIPNVDIVINYGRVKSGLLSHRLCPVTRLEQAGYGKKSHCSCGSTFSHNQPARAGYVVHIVPALQGRSHAWRRQLLCLLQLGYA
jgi:hypothetical protein